MFACFECRGELVLGDSVFTWEIRDLHGVCDEYVCSECFDTLFSEFIESLDAFDKARLIGSNALRVTDFLEGFR